MSRSDVSRLREAAAVMLSLFDDDDEYRELFVDHASIALEMMREAMLSTRPAVPVPDAAKPEWKEPRWRVEYAGSDGSVTVVGWTDWRHYAADLATIAVNAGKKSTRIVDTREEQR